MKYLFLILLIPHLSFAAGEYLNLTEEELNPEAEEVLIKKPEKYLRHESMIYDFNTDLGIKDQRRYTGNDSNRISIAGHVSSDYAHINNLLGADVAFMHRSTRYNQIWYGVQFFQNQTYFDAITQNHPANATADANSDSNYQRPGGIKTNVMAGGPGVGYRFKLILDFFQTEDMFETIDVFANYVQMSDAFMKKDYQGYGLTTNYAIHKRSSTSFFYGGKFSYNIASVTRSAIGTETKSERSLAIGWLSLAFEMGFFF
jgi:hypothetical protein